MHARTHTHTHTIQEPKHAIQNETATIYQELSRSFVNCVQKCAANEGGNQDVIKNNK